MPWLIEEEWIPEGHFATGSDLAIEVAGMFADLFCLVTACPDYVSSSTAYMIYVDRVYRQWHAFPKDPINVSFFHELIWQQILNEKQSAATAEAKKITEAAAAAQAAALATHRASNTSNSN
ncbi:hypothetical protein BT96DRAFT_947869 [Gymnopus androsaceus JB14]|uniref:Uncharacterized protein n=1 Tax=Gymnopus androsaceus JB14 TaxID=1447944 RepID=A0A6A4GRT9_9AGAR|nr:hypothetical protein BT96DRAFT_947869 [Gymnopus androsaceus JB14]